MPWHHDGSPAARPINVATGVPYRGLNILVLWATAKYGGWPSIIFDDDATDAHRDFDIAHELASHVAEGEIVVCLEGGAEKLRYITGSAIAFKVTADGADKISLTPDDIYGLAASKWGQEPSKAADMTDALKTRARELKNLRLAREVRRNVLQFEPGWRDALKAMELHLDIRKSLMQARTQETSRAMSAPSRRVQKDSRFPFGFGF